MDYEIVYITLRLMFLHHSENLFRKEIEYIRKKYTKIERCDGEFCGYNGEFCDQRTVCEAQYKSAQKIKAVLELNKDKL